VLEEASVISAGAPPHGVADYGVEREAPGGWFLDQAKGVERRESAFAPSVHARKHSERGLVHVVAFHVSQHAEQAAARERQAPPDPVDQQRDFRQIVLVFDDRDFGDKMVWISN
jgi:hypothetical protein